LKLHNHHKKQNDEKNSNETATLNWVINHKSNETYRYETNRKTNREAFNVPLGKVITWSRGYCHHVMTFKGGVRGGGSSVVAGA